MKNSKRRGAVKVPNVILRPAQASSSRSTQREASLPRVDVDSDENEDEFDLTNGNKPFSGVVLCATGELDKRVLFAQAQELGAIRTNDFTDQVTHLVADGPGSAKYRCAVERNLPILKETWVQEAYNTWLNGGVVELGQFQSIADHRLPIFTGVKLCLTGMDNVGMRSKMQVLLIQEGGVYMKSLDTSVTHLLCCASNSSDKIQWSKEYNQKFKSRKIQMVWEEWFWDSLEFGGRWDETSYDITNQRSARKSIPRTLQALKDDTRPLPSSSFSQPPLPKSIPTASLLADDAPEYGQTQKQRDVGLRILASIVQKRKCLETDATTQQEKLKMDNGPDQPRPANPILNTRPRASSEFQKTKANADSGSLLTRLANHRAASFAPATCGPSDLRQPFRRVISTSSTVTLAPQASFISTASSSTISSESRMLFTGYTFRAFGEAIGPTLRTAVEQHGGAWLEDNGDETEADFLLVRLASGGLFWREELEERERKRVCAGDEHVTFTPLKIITPVEGLDSAETCWTKRLIRAIGANFPSAFSRRSTHLVCPSGRGAKYDKAREWNVRVVNLDWLFAIANTGTIPDAGDFEVVQDSNDRVDVDGDNGERSVDIKGKGRADITEDKDGKMTDITNGHSQESLTAGVAVPLHIKQLTKDMKPRPLAAEASPSKPLVYEPSSYHTLTDTDGNAPSAFGKPVALLSDDHTEIHKARVDLGSVPSSSHTSRTPTRASTTGTEQDIVIPSSQSPSPLKILSKPPSVASPPIGETRGLRTAITALLGKRGTDAREDDGSTQRHSNRSSKRHRPPVRVNTDLELGHAVSPSLSLITTSSPLSYASPHGKGEVCMEEGASSLRVIYEDPDQRAEKKRLDALFEKKVNPNEDPLIDGGSGLKKEGECRGAKHQDTASKRKLIFLFPSFVNDLAGVRAKLGRMEGVNRRLILASALVWQSIL
ncbi:hypothetical protein BU17DRAFT_62242 [Hysterangium stoloniferum]|nr:hypothetical protein BU17DRAFT_62242 [Hysterangium stoloniferum]